MGWSIRRPVATLMIMLAVMVLGLVSLVQLELDILPKINPPVMAVVTELPGASAEEVLALVTERVEAAAATVSGIKELQSVSREGLSVVTLQFEWGVSMGEARSEVTEKLDVLPLPQEAQRPRIIRFDPGQLPMMQVVAASGDTEELALLSKRMEEEVKPRLEAVPGVAEARVLGGVEREVLVALESEKLYRYQVGVGAVAQIVSAGGSALPLGPVRDGERERNLRLPAQYMSRKDLEKLPVGVVQGADGRPEVVVLSDLGVVNDVLREGTSVTRVNGKPAVGLQIQKEGGSNTAAVASAVRSELEAIREDFGELALVTVLDQGAFIEETLFSSGRSLVIGGFFAMLVLLGFLGSLISTLIVAVAIPFSVLSTFFLLFVGGMSLNVMTLGGLALGVGMFVDNSIVVIENIFRHMQGGKTAVEAAEAGSREVAGAISASTLTTAVVFLPVVFIGGLTGVLFRELALTVTFALFSSLFVSLTVIPMLAARWLRPFREEGWRQRYLRNEPLFARLLEKSLRRRALVLLAVALLFAVSLLQISRIGTEFLPSVDEGMFSVDVRLPVGTPMAETMERAKRVEAELLAMQEIAQVTLTSGSGGGGSASLRGGGTHLARLMVAVGEEAGETAVVMNQARETISAMQKEDEEIVLNLYTSLFFSPGSSANLLQLTVSGPDAEELRRFTEVVVAAVDDVPGLSGVQSNADDSLPEYHLEVDGVRALSVGLLPAAVGREVRQAVVGQWSGRLRENGRLVDVRVALAEDELSNGLAAVPVAAPGGLVPLSAVATVREAHGPVAIYREGQRRTLEITGQVEGRDIGSVTSEALAKAEALDLPHGYRVRSSGTALLMQEGFDSLKTALLLSLVLIYLVMAAQFESLRSPFVILLTAPLGVVGVVAALMLTGTVFGITAYIGVIMLGGIVVNNGIVLVDFMEKTRAQGKGPGTAAAEAVTHRTRPVLMTAFTTILGLLPLAAHLGEGTELQAPLARVVIGGLLTATLLTLVVVPLLYTLFYGDRRTKPAR